MFIQIVNKGGDGPYPICSVMETLEAFSGTKDNLPPFEIIEVSDGAQEVFWKTSLKNKKVKLNHIRHGRWCWDKANSRFQLTPGQDKREVTIDVFEDWEPE